MVDNIYRESDGYVYNWVAGSGELRFSVGNLDCEKLSQSFTDRLPAGDMPKYSQTYADSLNDFVSDCVETGEGIRTLLGWSAFTPKGIVAAVASSSIAAVIVGMIYTALISRMLWQMNYSGRKRKENRHSMKINKIPLPVVFYALFLCSPFLRFLVTEEMSLLIGAGFFALCIFFTIHGKPSGRKTGKAEKEADKAPFYNKDKLKPDSFQLLKSDNDLVKQYTELHSSGGSSGGGFSGGGGSSSGGGSFSGGGSSGGGFSGGGSRR